MDIDISTEVEKGKGGLKIIQGKSQSLQTVEISNIAEYKPHHPAAKRRPMNTTGNIVNFSLPKKKLRTGEVLESIWLK